MSKPVKLSPAQQKLLGAIRRGVKVYFISGTHAHYFRSDSVSVGFKTAEALLKMGVAERFNVQWNGHQLRATTATEPKERTDAE